MWFTKVRKVPKNEIHHLTEPVCVFSDFFGCCKSETEWNAANASQSLKMELKIIEIADQRLAI